MKLSPWFPASNPPVRDGYYDLYDGLNGSVRRLYFDVSKSKWRNAQRLDSGVFFTCTRDKWRGMMNEGKKK